MTASEDQIRDQTRDTRDRFAAGWRAWDANAGRWLAPVGQAMIAHADLGDRSQSWPPESWPTSVTYPGSLTATASRHGPARHHWTRPLVSRTGTGSPERETGG